MADPKRTLPALFLEAARRRGSQVALQDAAGTVTLNELIADAGRAAAGLLAHGVQKGDRIGFYADNSRRWILTDLAIQLAGGVSVPRGTDTPPDEYAEILAHAGVGLVLVDHARHAAALEAVRAAAPDMGAIICIHPEQAPGKTLDDLLEAGRDGPGFEALAAHVGERDLATIIYTSGTTGRPKGVMLDQSNFGHQAAVCPDVFAVGRTKDDAFLSVLPPWHIFERTVEYIAICGGARVVYTSRRHFKDDLAKYEPTFVPSVPRIWETIYDGIQKALDSGSPLRRAAFRTAYACASIRTRAWDRARGWVLRHREPRGVSVLGDLAVRAGALVAAGVTLPFDFLGRAIVFRKLKTLVGRRLRGAISGGGLMPAHIDRFFRTIELPILIGYGLTETSPVCTLRRIERNVLGTIGTAVPEVEMLVRSPETGEPLPPGQVGVICTRGPHVMQGYYRDEELTQRVLGADGWFDTGDLGLLTEAGDLCFRGRLKETIVLKGGENVEPSRVEEALVASPLIEQAIVVGQDRKGLAALVLPDRAQVCPRFDLPRTTEYAVLAAHEGVRELLRKECMARTRALKGFEQVRAIAVLDEPLSAENGLLTQTLKPRRHVIVERYQDRIEEAYA
ncbi:MAG: AMP-binding protein [Planctomycetota bacterium]|nr:AMP-binding protein [Planctomycetota bacterium]